MQHHHETLIGHALVVGRQTSNVVAAPDDHRAGALCAGAVCGQIDGLQYQPRAWQALAIPGHSGWVVRHHQGLTFFAHFSRFQLSQIGGQQGQAMRGVAQQVALQQHFGHGLSFVRRQACGLQKLVGKSQKVSSSVVHGLHHKNKRPACCRHLDSMTRKGMAVSAVATGFRMRARHQFSGGISNWSAFLPLKGA